MEGGGCGFNNLEFGPHLRTLPSLMKFACRSRSRHLPSTTVINRIVGGGVLVLPLYLWCSCFMMMLPAAAAAAC